MLFLVVFKVHEGNSPNHKHKDSNPCSDHVELCFLRRRMDLFGAEGDGEKVEGGAAVAASDFHVRGYNVGGKRVY